MSKEPFFNSCSRPEDEHERFKFGTFFAIIRMGRKGRYIDIFPLAGYDFLHFRGKFKENIR